MESVNKILAQIKDRTQDAKNKIIPDAETVTLTGNTGVGKTTLLCGLIDEALIAMKQNGVKIKIGCKQNSKFQDLIGHTQKSATKYINYQQMNLAGIPYKVIDCAGFGDTGTDSNDSTCDDRDAGVENLKNIVLLKYVLDNCKRNRLLIVLDYQQITADRQSEVNPISILIKMVPNLIQYVKSIGIVVTKSNSDDQKDILESLYEAFYQHKHFIEVVANAGNIVFLPRPHKENIGEDLPGDYFKLVKQMIQKLRSTEFTQIQSTMEDNARCYIDSQVKLIINNLENQFNQTYQQLENFINSFKESHRTTEYEKSLVQLEKIKQDLPVNSDQGNIQKILDSINSVIQSFSTFINQSQNIEEVNKNINTLKDFCLLCPRNDSNSQPILQFNKNISYKIDDGIKLLKAHVEAQKQKEEAQRQKEKAQSAFREMSQLKNEIQQKDLRSKVMGEIAQLNNLYQESKYDDLIQRVNDFERKESSFNEINQSEEYKSFYFLASKACFRQNHKRLDEYHIRAQIDKYLRNAQKDDSELKSQLKSDFQSEEERELQIKKALQIQKLRLLGFNTTNFNQDRLGINLYDKQVNKDLIKCVVHELKCFHQLKELDLRLGGKEISDEDASQVADTLKSLPNLAWLKVELHQNNIRGQQCTSKLSMAFMHLTQLTWLTLDLSNNWGVGKNEIGDEGLRQLSEGFKHLINLTTLRIRINGNKITKTGISFLSDAIKSNKKLEILEIYCWDSNLTDEDIKPLIQVLKSLNLHPIQLQLYFRQGNKIPKKYIDSIHSELGIYLQ